MRPILCFVVDRNATRRPILEVVEAAVRAGVDWVQIRDRELDSRALFAHALDVSRRARRAAEASGQPVRILVNRRIDVALALCADGAHLGGDAIDPLDGRTLLGDDRLLGRSTHSVDGVKRAADAGCDYVHLAPIFAPISKRAERPALGVAAIEAASAHGIPVLAQGGLRASHCRELLSAGAQGIAVTGSISLADDPGSAAAQLRAALDA